MGYFIGTESIHNFMPKKFPGESKQNQFGFGLELEYLIVDSKTFRPLWYRDLSFVQLQKVIDQIDLTGINDGWKNFDVELPQTRALPFIVEGYHIPDADFKIGSILPKGIEIRTAVYKNVQNCVRETQILFQRMQQKLNEHGMMAVALSHHPVETEFFGPPNKRRYDFWKWSMAAMLTYGPDINVSVPSEFMTSFNRDQFDLIINYYSPAITALSVASPFFNGQPWMTNEGNKGLSIRTFKRSVVAPPLEYHGDESNRIEYKTFEMSRNLSDFEDAFFLVLGLILCADSLKGRHMDSARIYDLGQVSQMGLQAPFVKERLHELVTKAESKLTILSEHSSIPGEYFSTAWVKECAARIHMRMEKNLCESEKLLAMYEQGGFPAVFEYASVLE